LADADRKGQGKLVQVSEIVPHILSGEEGRPFLYIAVDAADKADSAVRDLLLTVDTELHHFVIRMEGRAHPYQGLRRGIELSLEVVVEVSVADYTTLHGYQHLDVIEGIEAVGGRKSAVDQVRDEARLLVWIFFPEGKTHLAGRWRGPRRYHGCCGGHSVCGWAGDGSAEYIGKPGTRDPNAADRVGKVITGADTRELVDIPDQAQPRIGRTAFRRPNIGAVSTTVLTSSKTRRSQASGWSLFRRNPLQKNRVSQAGADVGGEPTCRQ
jgi:hypothetical protein